MKNNNILLIIVLIAIVGLIFYFESTKPNIDNTNVESDILIESLENNNSKDASINVLTLSDIERIKLKSEKYERAKELINPDGYINVDNITLSENIGKKVILIDFWTYSCINCQRTLPYLTSWSDKYKKDGLVIIGVHTPEFEFEKDYDNVVKAVNKYEVNYPVVLDNDRKTWRSYKNRYWPRKYLIDIDGFIVYDHIGEGAYEKTEIKIQELLKEKNKILSINNTIDSNIVSFETEKLTSAGRTPEIYFGYGFSKAQLGNIEGWQPNKIINYTFPENKNKNLFYLDGSWKNNKDNMELVGMAGDISNGSLGESLLRPPNCRPTPGLVLRSDRQQQEIHMEQYDSPGAHACLACHFIQQVIHPLLLVSAQATPVLS